MKKALLKIENTKFLSFFFRRDLFALVYTTVIILWSLPLIKPIMDYPSKFCFLWGAGLIFWDLLTHRRVFRTVFWGLPLLMVGSFCITILLNPSAGIYALAKHLIYLCLALLLLYARDRDESEEELKALLRRLFNVVIAISLCTALISLSFFVFRYSFKFWLDGLVIRQGFLENRLFGIYYSPNAGALFSVLSIGGMLLNAFLYKERGFSLGRKIYYAINLAVQTVYFSVTLSRGGVLTLLLFLGCAVLGIVLPKLLQKKQKMRALMSTALALVVVVFGAFGALEGLRIVMPSVNLSSAVTLPAPDFLPYELYTGSPDDEEEDPFEEDPDHPLERTEDDGDVSNGRLSIWKGSLKLLAYYSPVFGLGDFKITAESLAERFPEARKLISGELVKWMFRHHGNLHNAYIQILVYAGAVGLLLFLIFALLVFIKVLKVLLRANPSAKLYPIVALCFSLLISLMANALVEAHLLFRGPNMFWAIFWILTGVTVLLAERLRTADDFLKEEDKNSERFAFAVASPLQAIHTVNLASHDLEGCKGSADCYVCEMFTNADQLAQKLRETGLFANVYTLKEFKKYSGAKDKIAQLLRVLFPAAALRKYAEGKLPIRRKVYRHILMSNAIPFMSCLWLASPGADVWFFEDGTGSYFGDFSERSPAFQKIDNFFFEGKKSVHPARLYLSAPELSRSKIDCPTEKLPALTDETTLKITDAVFDYRKNDLYRTHRFIYLSQPYAGDANRAYDEKADAEVRQSVAEICGDEALIRRHPRDKAVFAEGIAEDEIGNIWELECIRSIGEKHVLIGAFSTSQFMPLILSGASPAVIFTYKLLFADLSVSPWPEAERMIEDFKKASSAPERIYCPETAEELREILMKLKNE